MGVPAVINLCQQFALSTYHIFIPALRLVGSAIFILPIHALPPFSLLCTGAGGAACHDNYNPLPFLPSPSGKERGN